jgi:adenosine deaminase/aminodeoxyfutalosine deaminase
MPETAARPEMAELHLHLEGSIEAETLRELAPFESLEEIQEHYRHADFQHFLKNYGWVTNHLQSPADYALITRRLLSYLDAQNVTYAELNLSAGVILWKQQDLAEIFTAANGEARSSPITVRWIFDAVRQFGVEHAMRVAEAAAERSRQGVVAFGLGGDEQRGPARWFKDVCRFARESGLHLSLHAGESAGPESVWEALEAGTARIGHGIRALEDPLLIAHLRDRRVPLEICITSNLATGVVPRLEDHPVRRLFDAGVPITLNTDDPALFRTSLAAEYEIARRVFGFSRKELDQVRRNAFRFAFDAPAT